MFENIFIEYDFCAENEIGLKVFGDELSICSDDDFVIIVTAGKFKFELEGIGLVVKLGKDVGEGLDVE